ncbi:hypothetical protein SLEP1_g60405 [Rubroshorea leprosula]|uniref:Uncharacterized protein n=1 Tax=Rubroshorea leprosula TaxID=152421 RepID=A0AAV5MZB9_9ROSI|nr:hypothetical protein SLEP1_g60405 [Rubroshorea leprosula]
MRITNKSFVPAMCIRKYLKKNIPVPNKAPAPSSSGAVRPVQTPTPSSVSPVHDNIGAVPTGNINKGPGAGAHNTGAQSASINNNRGEINSNKRDGETVPPKGNLNKGPGAGGINSGTESASINGNTGTINF